MRSARILRRVLGLEETCCDSDSSEKLCVNAGGKNSLGIIIIIILTREELMQMDQTTRKLMTMHKALHLYNDIDYMFQEKKEEEEEDSPALKIASMHQYKDSNTT